MCWPRRRPTSGAAPRRRSSPPWRTSASSPARCTSGPGPAPSGCRARCWRSPGSPQPSPSSPLPRLARAPRDAPDLPDPALELVGPAEQLGHVLVGQPFGRGRLHYERGGGPLLCPGRAGLVDVVVDPGGGVGARVLVDGLDLPVGGAEDGAAVEDERGELAERQLKDERQVLIRTIFPAGGPHEVKPFS